MSLMRSFLRALVALVMLGGYALLPAAAWVHEAIEHVCINHVTSNEPSDRDSEKHHDSSHCQVCLTIHSSANQVVVEQVQLLAQKQPCAPLRHVDNGELICIDSPSPRSPRAPPVA